MQILLKCFLFLVRYRVWIGLGAVGVLVFSYRYVDIEPNPWMLLLVFSGTWGMYYLQRWTPQFRFSFDSKNVRNKALQFWGMLYIAVVLITLGWVLRHGFSTYPFLVLLSVPAFLYAVLYVSVGDCFKV